MLGFLHYRLLASAPTALADRLDRHVRREGTWLAYRQVGSQQAEPRHGDLQDWALPLVFSDVIDLDALPSEHREALVRQRLAWLRPGETVRLQARSDLHWLWRRQHAHDHNAHSWVYEEDGPTRWQVRITRRTDDDC